MMMDARGEEGNTRLLSSSDHPIFTSTQWQELEHQALIYKYMVSGVPIPPQLLFFTLNNQTLPSSSTLQYPIGWGGYFQVGNGRKADPEPGRCRRTDGKKWRCSKEANHPNSKYCERHMHRGKNRSRKPVEISPSTTTTTTTTTTTRNSYYNPTNINLVNPCSYSSISDQVPNTHNHTALLNPNFLYPHPHHHNSSSSSSSSSRDCSNRATIGSEFSPRSTTPNNLFLDPVSSSPSDKDYRYLNGMRDDHNQPQQLISSTRKLGYCSPPSEFESFYNCYPSKQDCYNNERQEEKHCFVLGADFKSSASVKVENGSNNEEISQSISRSSADHDEQTHKPLHHFFGIGGGNCSDSWLDLASTSSRPS
ncbi:Growth-regulating factor 5 [Linum grandiflorum]